MPRADETALLLLAEVVDHIAGDHSITRVSQVAALAQMSVRNLERASPTMSVLGRSGSSNAVGCKMPRPAPPLWNRWIGAILPSSWDLLIRRI
ncbi:MAG TPA: hypothetical protein VI094_16845 [Propionibacteriaceae bacterium]